MTSDDKRRAVDVDVVFVCVRQELLREEAAA